MPTSRSTRRGFLKLGLSTAAMVTVPAHFLAPGRATFGGTPPSERICTGHIGVNGRGSNRLRRTRDMKDVDVVGVCDVDLKHLQKAHATVWRNAEAVADYRRILDNRDVDAVVIATPDHWHAQIAIEACQAGKDVYCEKPLCTFLSEGRRMVNAARMYQRVVQVGIHHRSNETMRDIVEIIRSGRIGKVHTVKNWMWANPVKEPTPASKPPGHLDYDRWLGQAQKVPYHPDRIHFNFRWCRDYAGGYMTDWGVHMLNVVAHAMDIDHTGPVSVEASGTYAPRNIYDFPLTMEARWEFKDPDFTMTWTQPSDGGDLATGQKYGMTFYGEAGELRTFFHGYEFYVDGKKAELPKAGRTVELPPSPGHIRNWLDCIHSRNLPIADVEIGHRTTSLCQLGNIALDTGRKLRWDPQAEVFIDDQAANRLLARSGTTS